jgi:hypothetical protein
MNRYQFGNRIRVTKAAARKAYDLGKEVTLCQCLVNLDSPWNLGCPVHKDMDDPEDFQTVVNNFHYYNRCPELGTYPAYYLRKEA